MPTRMRTIAVAASLMAVFGLSALIFGTFRSVEEYARFDSPDGRHALVVYRRPTFFAMPGQGGDAPGTVVLIDKDGTELRRRELEMVQTVHRPRWLRDRVEVTLILDWAR